MLAELLHRVAGMQPDEPHTYYPRPSMAGPERCIRQMTYQRTEQPPDKQMGDRMRHVLYDSSFHETLTDEWIAKTAFVLHSQQMGVSLPGVLDWMPDETYTCGEEKCKQTVNRRDLHGHIDGVLTDMLGVDRLHEHKALNHFTFERYWAQTEYPEDYFTQVAIYLKALQALNPLIAEGLLLIKNKNTSGFIEYLCRYDSVADTLHLVRLTRHTGESVELNQSRPDIVRTAIEKFRQVEEYAKSGIEPARPFEPGHWRCEYCPFQETCWDGFVEEADLLADEVELDAEMADMVRYYKQLGAEIAEQEKEKDEIRAKLLGCLKLQSAKKGKAGEYVVTLVRQEKSTVDWEQVPLTVKAQLDHYRKKSYSEYPKVTNVKKKKEGK